MKWKPSNLPGQEERFRKLEERYDQMKINFDNINASLEDLKAAVSSANQKIADLEAQIGAGAEDQAQVDAIAATVSAEADKLRPSDAGPSTGGITA